MSIDADGSITTSLRASDQDGSYPRPQLVREHWHNLCGTWGFAYDDADEGNDARWFVDTSFERNITVPFPPESTASGIGDTGFHRLVWYSREITADDISAAGNRVTPHTLVGHPSRLMLHFGAVDYRAQVWLDGNLLGSHEGGHTPFSFDITRVLDEARNAHILVVRAEDNLVANKTGVGIPMQFGITGLLVSGSQSGWKWCRRPVCVQYSGSPTCQLRRSLYRWR